MNKKIFIFLPVFILIFALDQVSKWWVKERFFEVEEPKEFLNWLLEFGQPLRDFQMEAMTSFLNFVVVWNKGVSFGLFANDAQTGVMILSGLAILICIFFFGLLLKSEKQLQHVAIGMIIAGALSNVWDRVRFGAVYDFIDFHVSGWHYPAFNVADSAITVGVILFIFAEFFISDNRNNFVKKVGRWHAS
ncbi:MAG: signal peptidase II [Rickettsiales bacterium]|nr:signal peptidase II [Rickettsiales bacterium]|tara:strand:- start:509 stop:1078 length:570 start_codon:yes stop_codon:yes gene_type:complete